MSEALQGAVEILREQTQILKDERDLIKDLYGIVGMMNRKETRTIGESSEPDPENPTTLPDGPIADDLEIQNIIAGHGAGNSEVLAKLISDGRRLLSEGNERQGLQMLERARLLSPRNPALLIYFALQLFLADRFSRSAELADQALVLAPDDRGALLLSGVGHGELGNLEKAKRHLSLLVNDESSSTLVNFAWGMFSALEANWTESIAAFKQCGSAPEIEYLIGCAYFQLRRYQKALRHLEAVVAADPDYADAWFVQSLIFKELGDLENEGKAFERASKANDPASQCHEFLKRRKPSPSEAALPFRHLLNRKNAVLSGGSTRIRRFFRDLVKGSLGTG